MGASRTLMMITQDNSHISDWTGQDFMISKSKGYKILFSGRKDKYINYVIAFTQHNTAVKSILHCSPISSKMIMNRG